MEVEGDYSQIREEEQIHRGLAVLERRDSGSLEVVEVGRSMAGLQVERGRTILAVPEEEQESQWVVLLPRFPGHLVSALILLVS
jgi:hypothetical protein